MKRTLPSSDQLVAQVGASTASAGRLVASLDVALDAVSSSPHDAANVSAITGTTPTELALAELVVRIHSLSAAIRTPLPQGAFGSQRVGGIQVEQLERILADAQKEAKRLRRSHQQALRNADEWERNAMLSVRSGDDELAKDALARRAEQTVLAGEVHRDLKLLEPIIEVLEPLVAQVRSESTKPR